MKLFKFLEYQYLGTLHTVLHISIVGYKGCWLAVTALKEAAPQHTWTSRLTFELTYMDFRD